MSGRRMTSEEMLTAAMARCSAILTKPDRNRSTIEYYSDPVGDDKWNNWMVVKGLNFKLRVMVWPAEEENGK